MARHGSRIDFFDLPGDVVNAIQSSLGSPVVAAQNAAGGFTPGPAARCNLEDGRTVFIKSCGNDLSPLATTMHRQESLILSSLPEHFPAPSLITTVDQGGWFALVTECIKGEMPAAPLDGPAVKSVLDLVTELAEHGADCNIPDAYPVGTHELERINRWAWRKIRDEELHTHLDGWSARNLDRLIHLEDDWIQAASGSNLLHRDLRTDNMIIGPERSVAVDWPTASFGARWVDLVGLLPALHLDGGPPPDAVFDSHPVAIGAESSAVDCYLAALAGFFTRQALLPPVPGVEGVRQFQADQGRVARTWLAKRLDRT